MFPVAFPTVFGLLIGAAGPVELHVGVLFADDPTEGATDDPTDGATDEPLPESPFCARANELVRAKAPANPIVVSFMVLSFSFRQNNNRTACSLVPSKSCLSATEAASRGSHRTERSSQRVPPRAMVIEAVPLNQIVKPSGAACSAHHLTVEVEAAFPRRASNNPEYSRTDRGCFSADTLIKPATAA